MAFPTIPTGGRILGTTQANANNPRSSPDLSGLTKNSGDLLVCVILAYQSSAASGYFSSWTSGWTEFIDQGSSTGMCIGAAYKWSTGSETGVVSATQVATITGHAAIIVMSIAGAHGTTAPEGSIIYNGTAAAADPDAFDPGGWATEDTLWIAVGANGEVSTGGAWGGITAGPASYSDYFQTGVSGDIAGAVEGAVAFRALSASSEDVGGFTLDTSNARNSALLLAIRPAAAAQTIQATGVASESDTAVGGTKVQPNTPVSGGVASENDSGLAGTAFVPNPPLAAGTAGESDAIPVGAVVQPQAPVLGGVAAANESVPTGSYLQPQVPIAGGVASENDSALAGSVGGAQLIEGGVALESDSVTAGTISQPQTPVVGGTASENDSATAGSILQPQIPVAGGTSSEEESAPSGSITQPQEPVLGSTAADSESAPAGQVQQRYTASPAVDSESAPAGAPQIGGAQTVIGGLATENDSAPAGQVLQNQVVAGGVATENDAAVAGQTGMAQTIPGGTAAQSDVAVGGQVLQIYVGTTAAAETDSPVAGTVLQAQLVIGQIAVENEAVPGGTVVVAIILPGGTASEGDVALAGVVVGGEPTRWPGSTDFRWPETSEVARW